MPQTLMIGTRGKIYKSTIVDVQKLAVYGQIGVKFLSLGVTISDTIVDCDFYCTHCLRIVIMTIKYGWNLLPILRIVRQMPWCNWYKYLICTYWHNSDIFHVKGRFWYLICRHNLKLSIIIGYSSILINRCKIGISVISSFIQTISFRTNLMKF